ncbi:MAG: TrbC/VirB2 family protein [Methanobacteriota archaeon]
MKKKAVLLTYLLSGFASASASRVLGNVLRDFLCTINSAVRSIVGAVGVLILIVAGLKWIWAQDDPGERKQAKYLIENVLLGVIVVAVASGLVLAVLGISVC